MSRFLWSCAALLTLFVTVESLTCSTCDPNILGFCLVSTPMNCTAPQNNCYTAIARFSTAMLPIYARGCIEASACRNESNQSILTVSYNITRHCCYTDICNGAASIQLTLSAALSASLVAFVNQLAL